MEQRDEVKAAWLFARQQEVAPNWFVSINWDLAPAKSADLHPLDRIGLLRDGIKSALKREARRLKAAGHVTVSDPPPVVWIEVREKPPGKGEGVHLAYYVPEKLEAAFSAAVHRLVAHQSASVAPKAVVIDPIRFNWWELLDYLMKGGDDEVLASSPGARRHRRRKGSQGVIEGPRVRVAHAIGPTARKAAEKAAEAKLGISATPLPGTPEKRPHNAPAGHGDGF